jgi:hypothetical protein
MQRRSPARAAIVAFAAGLLAGCNFDSSGSVADRGDGGAPGDDGGDPGPCPAAIHAELTVNGVAASDGEPVVTVLVGDSVRLDASGSCVESGTREVAWSMTGDGDGDAIEGTAAPDLASPVVDVYPVLPGDYSVTLTVSDGTSSGEPLTVGAFRAVGWQVSDQALDVRDLATTSGNLWVATSAGAYQLALSNVLAAPVAVNDMAQGDDDIPNDLSAVADGPDSTVWFGHKPSDSFVWRIDLDPAPRVSEIDFTANFQASEVNDIGRGATGVVIATRNGVSAAPDNQNFEAPLIANNSFALTRGGSGGWAGGARLFQLPDGTPFDLFGVGDNKIRALLDVDGEIWVGTDNLGLVRFDPGTGTVSDIYTAADDGLPSDKGRAIAVDTTGDVWVATDKGVARYKRDRDLWVALGGASGLGDAIDVTAITAVGTGAARAVIAGTRTGLALLALP